ncbi:MAG: aminotransferase class I/II-fold pyridoxal phosphate-dependent enzyme [Bacteroidetes bacterium]|nr:aminotransferase class I/II-fold pyridoxal phosphate-dependent enzyme [Bacteroidota bacterium]
MPSFKGQVFSKLPHAGTSIFAIMSKMAADFKAVNLSQGFPDFPISEKLIARVNHYMKKGFNQYAPMPGVESLRKAIAKKVETTYGVRYSPDTEITVTAGATQALYTAISTFVKDSDEVIIFEPAYDSYAPAVKANGGLVKYAELKAPFFKIDWNSVKRMVSNRTRMIIINSPHNPTGSLLTAEDMQQLEMLTSNTDIIVLSDEVYEHLIFDGIPHQSVCLYPELLSRSFVIGSFGKTFHATGWKTGFVLSPEELTKEFRKLHQFVVFAANTPIQHAIADFIADPENYSGLPSFYQAKRDYFVSGLAQSRFKIIPCYGTYFQLLDYSAISDESEMAFAERLVKENGIAVIPVAPFYHNQLNQQLIRVCFAKTEETLAKATEILCRI